MNSSSIGVYSLFLAAFLYGSQNIATRYTGLGFGPFLITAMRAVVVILVLGWFVKWKKVKAGDWKWFGLRAIGNVIATTGIFIAVNHMSVGAALFTFYASMALFGTIFGMMFFKENLTRTKLFSLVLSALGLLLINNNGLVFNWYVLVSIIGGAGASLWSVFSRPISSNYSLKQLVVIDNILATMAALIISGLLHEPWGSVKLDYRFVAIIYLGLTQVFTGQLVARGFSKVNAQLGSVILLNDTIVGMILAFIIFKETTTISVILGGVCIFLSSIIPAILEQRRNRK